MAFLIGELDAITRQRDLDSVRHGCNQVAQECGGDHFSGLRMVMLDAFDRLGKMPLVAESIKTLRAFGGNLAIVTQTIPALDEIYGKKYAAQSRAVRA